MTIEFLKSVLAHVSQTDKNYRSIYNPSIVTHPIPFFGNFTTAEIITVGLNPSVKEFEPARGWPEKISVEELNSRLQNYFSQEQPKPHPFFKPWSNTFRYFATDLSYANGKVAHLDLSPRATDFPSNHQTNNPNDIRWREEFLKMLSEDILWFFEALKKCKQAKLIMMAGTATKHFYLDQFISKHAPLNTCLKYDEKGNGKNVSFYNLVGLDMKLPVFFSGAGPAFQQGARLVQNVSLNLDTLNSKLRPT